MARLSYQQVRYRLVAEEKRLYKLLDEMLQEVKDDEGITARYTIADIDHFYENVERRFQNLIEYAEALDCKKHEIIMEMRVEVINDVCEGNAFKGTKFNDRVNNILALRLILGSMQQYSVKAIFQDIVDPNTHMDALLTVFGIRGRTANVNWEESEPYEQAYESRRHHQPLRDFFEEVRRAHANTNTNEDFWEYVGGSGPNTESTPEPNRVVLSPEGWPLNEVWAYTGEASLHGTTYEEVLNIESSITFDQLKAAYHKSIKASHQDATGSDDQQEHAKQVVAAYRVAKKILAF